MIKKTSILAVLFVFISALSNASVAMQDSQTLAAENQADEQYHIFKVAGAGNMYKRQVPGLDEEAMCFDVELYNARDEWIGSAIDCLSDVQPKANGLTILGTTFFYLPQGTIVTRGKISIQPVLEETILESGQAVTHITGASNEGNTIIDGTGIYANSTGNIRLSGLVDMSQFEMNEGDVISFSCFFNAHIHLNQ
jgi:hypothetical protein